MAADPRTSQPRRTPPRLDVKLAPGERDAAAARLPPGRSMTGFVRACLRALAADPTAILAALGDHWPTERTAGRPRNPGSRRARTSRHAEQ